MAAQTLTGVSNFDGPTLMLGLLNGEATTINGGALTIDGDVRWGQNNSVLGSITVSSTLGGSVLFEGRNVWELPYSATTGNVPTQAALGSNTVTGGTSGATGELIRVWAAGAITPSLTGAMPATGWIKLRRKTGNFASGEVVTLPGGATITLSGPGKRSWLHIVGAENGTITIPRLGDVKWRGEWYELGSTNGADDQTFQFPVADICPAIWIEKTVGSYAALGEAGLEPWINAADRWGTATPFVDQDVRGKFFGQVAATGVITIARRASNACGFKPASGLRVFVPNLILSNSSATNWANNTNSSNVVVRYRTSTNQGGDVDVQGVSANWYFWCTNPVNIAIRRSSFLDQIRLDGASTPVVVEDVAVGLRAVFPNYLSLWLANLAAGGALTRVRSVNAQQGSAAVFENCIGLTGQDVQSETFGNAGSQFSSRTVSLVFFQRSRNCTFENLKVIGARVFASGSRDILLRDMQYADLMLGNTVGPGADSGSVTMREACQDITIDGYSSFGGLANVSVPDSLAFSDNSSGINIFNVGSPTSEFDFGTVAPALRILQCSNVSGVKIRRVYTKNLNIVGAGSPVVMSGVNRDFELINVWSDGDDTAPIGGTNITSRGCRWGSTISAQSASYGRHWEDHFTSTTTGRFSIFCTEPTTQTADQCSTSFAPGSGFTSAGSLSMATVGDWCEWTMNYFALGHTAFAGNNLDLTGNNTGNHAFTFQVDTGSGFGSMLPMTGANMLAVGAINPNTGIKLRVRATVVTANANNLLSFIRADTVTDAMSQRIQYPITAAYNLTLENVVVGSAIRVETLAGASVYSATAVSTSMALPLTAGALGDPANNLRIKVRKGSASPFFQPWETQATAFDGSQSIFVSQIPDE